MIRKQGELWGSIRATSVARTRAKVLSQNPQCIIRTVGWSCGQKSIKVAASTRKLPAQEDHESDDDAVYSLVDPSWHCVVLVCPCLLLLRGRGLRCRGWRIRLNGR